jgi:hypothetical protein
MPLDARRIYVGSLTITRDEEWVAVDVSQVSVASFYAVPRYGADLTSWVCKIQHGVANSTPADFASALTFGSGTLTNLDKDMNGTDTVYFITTTPGTGGVVDIYMVGKSDA